MEILNVDIALDGGTMKVTTKNINDNIVDYCFDNRINTLTKNELYLGYPKNDNSNLVEQPYLIEKEIINTLKEYKHELYQYSIDNLIAMKQYLFL